jgi:hypothetical protein
MKKIIIITIVIFSLTAIVAKVTADKLQENERHSHTQEALKDLEDFFLFEQKQNQARDSHYLMRKIIEGNCASVGETIDNCRYVPKELLEKFQRFDSLHQPTASAAGCGKVIKKGWSEEASYWVQRAYDISGCDKEFVAKLASENGEFDPKRQSEAYQNGVREKSWGFCQIHCPSHPDICGSKSKPTWEGFFDGEFQLATCYELYKQGTKMYAPIQGGYKQLVFY